MTNLLRQVTTVCEGITHIEDLGSAAFIDEIETLSQKVVTEKVDGYNLWLGVDDKGFYTSREGKNASADRFYSIADYPNVANYNGFIAAHAALASVEGIIKGILKPGEQLEIEVMFGRQPNTVTYGKDGVSYICFLRGVNGTPDSKADELNELLSGKFLKSKTEIISSDDGQRLKKTQVETTWKIVKVMPVSISAIDVADLKPELNQLKEYLGRQSSLARKTNAQVEKLSLTSVPKADRPAAKAAREKVQAELMAIKMAIKSKLLGDIVRKIKPDLQTNDLSTDEDVGVEGVVIRDPNSNEQVKIVDKDVFTALNKFNSETRAKIGGSIKTTDMDKPAEMRGGIAGDVRIKICTALGVKELALPRTARAHIEKLGGLDEFAKHFTYDGDATALKREIVKFIDDGVAEIKTVIGRYKTTTSKQRIALANGKHVAHSPEVIKRTLTASAETLADLQELKQSVEQASTTDEVVSAVFKKQSQMIGTKMTEQKSLLATITEEAEATSTSTDTLSTAPVMGTARATVPMMRRLKKLGGRIVRKQAEFNRSSRAYKVAEAANSGLLRSINAGVASTGDVFQHLTNQDNDDDQLVDTVIFGLEEPDGQIVKVYVNVRDADRMEAELQKLIGKDGDTEELLNDLSEVIDIVHVKWPEDDDDEFTGPLIDLTTKTDEEDDSTEAEALRGKRFANALDESKHTKKKKKEDDAEEDDAEEDDDQAVAKMRSKHSSLDELLKLFPIKADRMIITLMARLGVPVKMLVLHKAELRDDIGAASDLYSKSAAFRTWVKKFLDSTTELKLTENLMKSAMTTPTQRFIFNILISLGLPAHALISPRHLIRNIKAVATFVSAHNMPKMYLHSIGKVFGIDEGDGAVEIHENVNDITTQISDVLVQLGIDPSSSRSLKLQLQSAQTRAKLRNVNSNADYKRHLARLAAIMLEEIAVDELS